MEVTMRATVTLTPKDLGGDLSDENLNMSGDMGNVSLTNSNPWNSNCSTHVPTAQELFKNMPKEGYIVFAVYLLFCILTIVIYVEEIIFIIKNFKMKTRKRATIWILAFFPVYSVAGLLGAVMPRSGTLVDMCANAFFGTCLYQFVNLSVNYMGGPKRMWEIVGTNRRTKINTPPCCCCCCCFPKVRFHRKLYFKWCIMVLQMAIVRPIIMFFAAVLWANGSYQPGMMSPFNGYVYITIINLATTLPAMWGLMMIVEALNPFLGNFLIKGKIASIQLTMLSTSIPNLIISSLVTADVITCTPLFMSKSRGETIYHGLLVLLMLPFSLIGRRFFRRASDGVDFVPSDETVQEVMTIEKDGKRAIVTITRLPENEDAPNKDQESERSPSGTPLNPEHKMVVVDNGKQSHPTETSYTTTL